MATSRPTEELNGKAQFSLLCGAQTRNPPTPNCVFCLETAASLPESPESKPDPDKQKSATVVKNEGSRGAEEDRRHQKIHL